MYNIYGYVYMYTYIVHRTNHVPFGVCQRWRDGCRKDIQKAYGLGGAPMINSNSKNHGSDFFDFTSRLVKILKGEVGGR